MRKDKVIITILVISLIFTCKDFLFRVLIKKDNNLENLEMHLESDYQNLKNEYDTLLDFKTQFSDVTISKVVLNDPLLFFDEVTILKGEEEQIKKGSAVINELGLVGLVKTVGKHSSVVSLLSNKLTKLSVKIGDTFGVLESDNGVLKVKNITTKNEITKGLEVKTSPKSNIDADILIGTVKEVYNTNQNLSTEIIVEPTVDVENLNYVYIKEAKVYE